LVLVWGKPFNTISLWASDLFRNTQTTPSKNIVVVGIDDATLSSYGKWSDWSRSLHGLAIYNLTLAGAKVIAYDILFADVSSHDQDLAKSIGTAGNVVLAGAGSDAQATTGGILSFKEYIQPTTILAKICDEIGHANMEPDADGVIRHIPLVIEDGEGKIHPALCLVALSSLFGMPLPDYYTLQNGSLYLFGRNIPVDARYSMSIKYSETPFTYISYGDIINGSFDHALVKNKIVLVGMTSSGEIDTWEIPGTTGKIPGVTIHAAAIDTILSQSFITEASIRTTFLIMLLLTCVCSLAFSLVGTRNFNDILKVTFLVAMFLLIYLVISSLSAARGTIMNVLYPSLILMSLYIGNILYVISREQADKRFVKELFGRYVSPQVSQEIVSLADTGKLNLGGEEKSVTILFADIRNFTTISERLSPDEVMKMLNLFLPIVIDSIVNNGGIVNKFAGDSIMGVWNAPQEKLDHAFMAIKAAWEAQQKLSEIPSLRQDEAVLFGIGVNTGKALVGNVGTSGRTEYTVIGDTVNLASRICSNTPGGEIWVGPETFRETVHRVDTEALEPQIFKGKSQPIIVYRVKGMVGINSFQ
jgi:adenylate cyclase